MSQPSIDSSQATAADAINQLKQVEAQLMRMTKVFMDGADPIVIRDLDGNVLDINLETERVFGWTRDEVVGSRAKLQLAPESRDLADQVLSRVQRGETVRNVEAAVRTKSGGVIPVLATVFLLTNENGQPVGYAEIAKDVSELKRANGKLAQRNRDLVRFGSVLTHDLRAPLHTIRGFADLLKMDHDDRREEQCQEYLGLILEGVDRMERLIGDVLTYARIESQEISLRSVDFEDVLRQVLANLHAAINEADARITSDPLPTLLADASQMIQLFQNLIGNAIKFRGVDPPIIHVSATRLDTKWEFSVRDNGIGMDEEDLARIFDAFQRLHADSVFPGTGIGLSICRSVVERHGGRIWVESERGKSSTFFFTIPDRTPHPNA